MSSSSSESEESPPPAPKRSDAAKAAAAKPAAAAPAKSADSDSEDDGDESSSEADEEAEELAPKKGVAKAAAGAAAAADAGKAATKAAAAPAATPAKVPANASVAGAAKGDVPLIVSSCANKTISEIIQGKYFPHSANHGKVVYKKEAATKPGALDVLIYFWDDRDGPELCGWWFGPIVGGEMVWAYHPSQRASTPPSSEWNVPHDGDIDPQFSVTAAKPGMATKAAVGEGKMATKAQAKVEEKAAAKTDDKAKLGAAKGAKAEAGPTVPQAKGFAAITTEAFMNAYKRRREEQAKSGDKNTNADEGSARKSKDKAAKAQADEEDDDSDEEEEEEEEEPPAKKSAAKEQAKAAKAGAEKAKLKEQEKDADAKQKQKSKKASEGAVEAAKEDKKEKMKAEKGKEARAKESKAKDDRAKDDKAKEGKAKDEKAKDSKADKAKMKEEKAKADKAKDEKTKDAKAKEDKAKDSKTEKAKPKEEKAKADKARDDKVKDDKAKKRDKEKDDGGGKKKDKAKDDGKKEAERDRDGGRRRGDDSEERRDRRGRTDDRRRDVHDKRRRRSGSGDGRRSRSRDRSRGRGRSADRRRRGGSSVSGDRRRGRDASRSRDRHDRRRTRERESDRRRGDKRDEDTRKRSRDRDDKRKTKDRRSSSSSGRADKHKRAEKRARSSDSGKDKKRRDEKDKGDDKDKDKNKSSASPSKATPGKTRGEEAKQDDDAKGLRQQQATLAMLSCFKKLSDASLENWDKLKEEYDRVIKKDLPDTGSQMDALKSEAERVFGSAKQYIEQLKVQKNGADGKRSKDEDEEKTKRRKEGSESEDEAKDSEPTKDEEKRDPEPPKRIETLEEAAARREQEKKHKEEEMRRKEEELQRRREERRKKEREELDKLEDKRRAEREVKRKEEEAKQEEERKKKEEQAKRREAEEDAKRQADAKARREQHAVVAVLRGLQKLSDANPDNFETLKAEFEKCMETELPETGAQKDTLKAEADRVFGYAKQYVEQAMVQQKQAKEHERAALKVLEEVKELAVMAEAAGERATELAKPLESATGLGDAETLQVARQVEKLGKDANDFCMKCAELLENQRNVPMDSVAVRQAATDVMGSVPARLQSASQQAAASLEAAAKGREFVTSKLALELFQTRDDELFRTYDKDGDGFLNRQEIAAFAKTEYQIELPAPTVDRILRQLARPGAAGVEAGHFRRLRTAVGIARHADRGRLEQLPADEREKVEETRKAGRETLLQGKRAVLEKTGASLSASAASVSSKVKAVEDCAEEFARDVRDIKPRDVLDRAVGAEAVLKSAHRELRELQASVRAYRRDLAAVGNLRKDFDSGLSTIGGDARKLGSRLSKAQDAVIAAKQGALQEAYDRYGALRVDLATKLRTCGESRGIKAVDLFQAIAQEGSDRIQPADVHRFLSEQGAELDRNSTDVVLASCAKGFVSEDEASAPSSIGRDDFTRLIRVYCKVLREVELMGGTAPEDEKPVRKLAGGEVVEVYQGPTAESAPGGKRIQARALKDGAVGWLSMAAADGTPLLAFGGNVLRVVKPCAMTEDFKDVVGMSRASRTLSVGQLLEVLDWSRSTLSTSAETRIRGRPRGELAIGWVSMVDAHGADLLEAA